MARKFEKRWNWMMEEYAYKDLETREVYTREDFFVMCLELDEPPEIVNKNDERNDDDDNPNKNRRYMSWGNKD